MKYPARFVMGSAGRYGVGHAWVTFQKEGRSLLLEPLRWPVGLALAPLSILRYKPKFSMAWDGESLSYYAHKDSTFEVSLIRMAVLASEWLAFWAAFWLRAIPRIATRLALRACGLRPGRPHRD